MKDKMEISIELFFSKQAAEEIVLNVEFDYRKGAPAHYGSPTYPGHPADPLEVEINAIYWPVEKQDCLSLPLSILPSSILAAMEEYIIENYVPEARRER